jgi:hypothetical protein
MKRWLLGFTGLLLFLVAAPLVYGAGSEMDILLKKLQQKGIISAEEAMAMADEAKKTAAEEKKEIVAEAKKGLQVPEWVNKIKFKGDIRLRYQSEERDNDANKDARGRGRMRLRFGAESLLADNFTAGFGLATGSGDPRSTNQTFQDTFSKKQINIDYAYLSYQPFKWLSLTGGKFENPLWRPTDLLWDSDITTEGAAVKVDYPIISPCFNIFFNGGYFILDEYANDPDPQMFALQGGFKWNITPGIDWKVGGAYYMFNHVRDLTLDSSSGTNTKNSNNRLKYYYNAPAVSTEIGFNNLFGQKIIPRVALLGEYINNPDPDRANTAYIAGIAFGHPKLSKFGAWNVEYTYRRLGTNAWIDAFPDSDSYGGATNTSGHRVKVGFGLTKDLSLGVNYFQFWRDHHYNSSPSSRNLEKLFQADLSYKF